MITQSVVAGSRAFTEALVAPLRLRTGVAPVVVRAPAEALHVLPESGALLVLEHAAADLDGLTTALRELHDRLGTAFLVVVAVPSSCSADAERWREAGVGEIVSWQGRAEPVLWAVDRLLSRLRPPPLPAAPPSRRLVPPPAPMPSPAIKPVALASSIPLPTRTRAPSEPAPVAPPRLTLVPAGGRPEDGARTGGPAAVSPVSRADAPPPELAPSLSRVADGPRAGPPVLVAAAPRSTPEAAPRPAPILGVVSGVAPMADPAPSCATSSGASSAASSTKAGLVAEPGGSCAGVAQTPPPAAGEASLPTRADEPPPWLSALPSGTEAEALLARAAQGSLSEEHVHAFTVRRVLQSTTELERAALRGEPTPVDPAPLRSASALRLRLALALTDASRAVEGGDGTLAQELVVAVDTALSALTELAGAAPPGVAPELAPLRHALVELGVKLAGVMSNLAPEPSPGLEPQSKPDASAAPVRREAATRVLANDAQEPSCRGARGLLGPALLAVALAVALAYHAPRLLRAGSPPPTVALAPPNTTGVETPGGKFVTVLAGRTVDPAELERWKAAEAGKGNVVTQPAPGMWLVSPAKGPPGGERRPGGSP